MREATAWFFGLLGVVALIYLLFILLAPLGILERKVDRSILVNSNQYIETQLSGINSLNIEYEQAPDGDQKKAILIEMCDLARKIPESEIPSSILSKVKNCI